MSLIVSERPQYVLLQWAADRLNLPSGRWVQDSRAVGVLDGVNIRAVLVLNQFTGEGCEASFVTDGSKSWATRDTVSAFIEYPFTQWGVRRVLARIAAHERDTQIQALRIGFQFEARYRAGMPDGSDAILFSMLHEEMPFVTKEE